MSMWENIEKFTDAQRQRLRELVLNELSRDDMREEDQEELADLYSLLSGTDTIIQAVRCYPSRAARRVAKGAKALGS